MRRKKERVNGPYEHGNRWRVHIDRADGARETLSFASKAEALQALDVARVEIDGRTIASAVDAYIEACRARQLKSVVTIGHRLRALLQLAARDRPLGALTPELARELWRVRAPKIAPDTQVGELAAARRFAAWCRSQGWLAGGDPFAGLEPTGPRRRGKAQLRIDEARRFIELALGEGDERGLERGLPGAPARRHGRSGARGARAFADRLVANLPRR